MSATVHRRYPARLQPDLPGRARTARVSVRELVVLGSAAGLPSRTRNHNGYVLRWDAQSILFDPGEGTQRQLQLAGVAAGSLTRICITHPHGDHCLGLPGVLQRLSWDGVTRPVELHYPGAAQPYIDSLRTASAHHMNADVRDRPVGSDGVIASSRTWRLLARALDHRVDAVGYRLEEADGRRMLPERLAAYGVSGPSVGELVRDGELEVAGRTVRLEDVSEPRAGQVFAFVMDTRVCDAAVELAAGADMLVCESTYLDADRALAEQYAHLTAVQAATIAREAGVRRLVLTHFSQRYGDDAEPFAAEARAIHPDVVAVNDLDRVPVPPRRERLQGGRRAAATT
jgi:ribonuclease Z